ncbi:hypothetical protein B0H17DRAFT_1274021 [Mycena rosella]|uniref:CoA-binding domain-containing protein n=1 Tax=Mycena rosella TaxID=1033263 RepID=A0AAD7MAM9_MYCRO|nr:hypothetical protein B0H17DRAFT_1274021 [Mycena rosella]
MPPSLAPPCRLALFLASLFLAPQFILRLSTPVHTVTLKRDVSRTAATGIILGTPDFTKMKAAAGLLVSAVVRWPFALHSGTEFNALGAFSCGAGLTTWIKCKCICSLILLPTISVAWKIVRSSDQQKFLSTPLFAVIGAPTTKGMDTVPVNPVSIASLPSLKDYPPSTRSQTSISIVTQPTVTLQILHEVLALSVFTVWLQPTLFANFERESLSKTHFQLNYLLQITIYELSTRIENIGFFRLPAHQISALRICNLLPNFWRENLLKLCF